MIKIESKGLKYNLNNKEIKSLVSYIEQFLLEDYYYEIKNAVECEDKDRLKELKDLTFAGIKFIRIIEGGEAEPKEISGAVNNIFKALTKED